MKTELVIVAGLTLMVAFAQFKRENLREDLKVEVPVSEKVLFRAFVSYKKDQSLK